jgi:ribonuclease P protein component
MPSARLGLVVTKKGTPKAHRRNRVKRIIRERFRLQAGELPAADIVVQVFSDLDDARLKQALDELFTTLSLELVE